MYRGWEGGVASWVLGIVEVAKKLHLVEFSFRVLAPPKILLPLHLCIQLIPYKTPITITSTPHHLSPSCLTLRIKTT